MSKELWDEMREKEIADKAKQIIIPIELIINEDKYKPTKTNNYVTQQQHRSNKSSKALL